MTDRTFTSVTDVPCACSYLERGASDPNSPIRYDPELNEYNIIFSIPPDTHGSLRVYHCPFCGGLTPESRRDKLFAVVPDSEAQRLRSLIEGIRSVQEVLEKLGIPDHDEPIQMFPGYVWPAHRDEKPSLPVRTMIFSHFSEVAEVNVTVYDDDSAQLWVVPKYLGPPRKGV